MWDALDIGSAPIQVLEPGCGTGNFMAGIPENIKANVSGVELDPISARIAAALNPDATILNADLADCTIHPGFDLTIGNVPYSGDISLDYRTTDGGTSRLPLHDYFIERSVDALRPGGVAMLLTSRYTLDKRSETMRADLARKAELVGAVRLPSSTFARQAGTEAVTDVLVLRRRERTLDRTPDEAWIHSNPVAVPGYQDVTVNVNQAVANDMTAHAVGDIRPVIGRFGGDFDVVFQGDAEQVGERLQELLSTQITHGPALSLGEAEPAGRAEITVRPDHVAPFEYSVDQREVVWYGDGATVTEIAHGQGDEARRLRGMIRLRDLARELQRLELDPARVDDPDVEAKRAELDRAYDRFTSEFGRLCDRANQRAYSGEESGCHLVMALEETDEKGRFAGKAKCLSQRTISPVPPMPDHADSLDDALDISLDRAGGVDLELIARLADTTVEEAETGLGDRIIRDPDTGEVMPAEDYLAGDVGTKLDHVTAMAEHLRRRAAREAMTEFAASIYATSEDMPAIEQAREWIDTAGTDVWRSLTDPYAAESYRDPTPVIERINDGRHGWTMGWNRNPELVLALVWRAVEELPERHSRVTLERSDTGERKPWHAPAWHRSHGTSPLWDALCWTWRDGDAPQHYAPILADRRMPVRDLALFVHKIAHTDRLETADKTAILSNLFESYSAHDKHGSTIWTDTTIGAMARRLMPGTDDPTRLAERLATDMSVSEWIWGIARDLPDLRQGAAHDAYGAPPRAIDARPDDYQAFRARREEQLGQWREQPEHAEAARADQTDAERLEHVADLLERVQPTPLETEQIKAPLGAPWIPARDVHDFMMETFNVRGHGLTPGKLSQYSVDWIPQLGQWRVGYSGGGDIDYKAARTYGTEDRNPFQLLEACLDNAQITVTKDSPTETTASGKPKRVKDQKATMAAIEKANAIRDAWNQWVFKDPDRAQRLTALYNRRFNGMRPRHVDGSYLTTPGIAHGVALRPHQKDAVARALRSNEGTLIAHVVGAGKTFEGVALSHEAKRLGKASKPMLVVPNHLVDQWAGDVLRLYPAGRVLVMDKDAQRNPESVRRFWGRVATGDWDAVIVPESRFSQLHVSKERRLRNMRARVDDLEQRLGRIQRQGNTYDHVRDYRYVTEGTFDAYSYQTVERKQRFISQLMSSKSPAREAADLDADVVTLANIKALATGDPDIQRRMTLENEINQLKLLRASWAQQKADTRRDINQQLQPRIEGIRQAIREKTDDKPLASKALSIHQTARMNGKWEGMTINGRPVGDRQTACKLLHQAAHQAHDGDTIAEYDGLPVIARRAATTGRITLAVKAVHEHESGTEMPGPYLTGPSSIVSQLDRIVKNMATDPGKLTERLADAERELAAAQETLAEPFAHEDEYRQKQAELERLTSKPDEPRETESRDQETKERSAGMPLTTENARRLLEQDHDVTEVTQGGNAMGHYLEARLTDGRAVQIDFHDNPAWKDTDRLAGRIEVSYANRPQAEWQYDDNDMADREHTVIDPADPAAGKTLAKAVEGWERAGGLHTARAAGTSHLAANQPPEEYAYRWRKPGDPDRHIAYLSTAFDRDQAMKAREDAGYVVTKVDEDPAVLYEQHRKASCMRASHILERYESPDQDAVRILHGIVGEVNAHDPENDIATYLAHPSDKAVQIAGDGLTSADIAEKREMGGWDPRKDPLMRINAQGDWTGITQQQADQIVWDNRDEILTRASYDSELSTWTLHQLDQLKEPQPAQSLDRDRPEPDHKAPAQADSTTKRHGPRL